MDTLISFFRAQLILERVESSKLPSTFLGLQYLMATIVDTMPLVFVNKLDSAHSFIILHLHTSSSGPHHLIPPPPPSNT